MAQLSAAERAKLPDTAFAYVDSKGNRRLPINDASHVRNALARFGRVAFESDAARQRARQRLLAAAKKHGIVPVGFIEAELRVGQSHAAAGRVVLEVAQIKTADELESQLRRALGDPTLSMLSWSSDDESWIDSAGRHVSLPTSSGTRAVTVLEAHGALSTALLHDPAALADADLSEAVLAAIRFVVERQRLEADSPSRRVDFSRLPSGFVTHLFTDIEGSTELLTELTDRYAAVLERVRKAIRQEVRNHGGQPVDTTGDETFSVFEDASAAVLAAVGIQRKLSAGRWPGGIEVRVRIGIHSGEVTVSDSGYVGLSVNTAARAMAAGHGGQILVTASTREALGERAPDGVSFHSLGAHRLKGLRVPVELVQVEADGLPSSFSALRVPIAR
jgi:class 3 adenylate cyclase